MPPATAPQVVELIRTLALGWKNLAAYPPGHPALVGAVENAHKRLAELRGPAAEVVFGISRDGLIYGEDKIDLAHAQKLAQALYTRGVALVRFHADVAPAELEAFLRLLSLGAQEENRRPIWEELTAAGVVNIHLQPVDYSAVQATEDLSAPARQQPVTLWDDILHALVVGRELTLEGRRLLTQPVRSMNELTSLVLQYLRDVARPDVDSEFDDDAFGIGLEARIPEVGEPPAITRARLAEAIGLHISKATGLRKQLAVQQVLQLLRSLPEQIRGAVLRSVIRALASDEKAGSMLRDVAAAAPADEVLDALRYLAGVTKLSSSAVKLLETLMPLLHKEPEVVTPAGVAELVTLFGEEDVDRFNPDDHKQLLASVSVDIPRFNPQAAAALAQLGDRVDTVADDVALRALGLTLLDLVERQGAAHAPAPVLTRLERVFQAELSAGRYSAALEILKRLQEIALKTQSDQVRNAVEETFTKLASVEAIDALVESIHTAPAQSAPLIHELIEAMGTAATRSLLIALAAEENRSRRRRLFNFVASLGTVIVPDAKRFLSDQRWFVVRNMIVLLRTVNDRTSLAEIRRCARHSDLRVRLEAIKSLLTFEPSVTQTLLQEALHDPDPKLAESAVALVGSYGIREAVDPLLEILSGRDVFGARKPLRIIALKALGDLAEPSALPRLEKFFREPFLPWPSKEERRAAFESLSSYPPLHRIPLAERGLRSRDPEIRALCQQMLEPME